MSKFPGFDEASRLYAEHAPLLEAMRTSYRAHAAVAFARRCRLELATGRVLEIKWGSVRQ